METDQLSRAEIRAEIKNIGGIDRTEVTLPPGVSILTGENATNRTSFLRALMAGLGSNQASLKGDADQGSVTIEVGDKAYTRTLTRRDGTVVFDGEPYRDDSERGDLFAFLLESNEARRTIARSGDLREIMMRPVDTDRLDAEIESCKQRRQEIDDEIERLNKLEQELPEIEAERTQKQAEIEEAREELASVQSELENLDTEVEQSRSQKEALEDAFERVREARSELEDLEFDLETERSTLSELNSERDKLRKTLDNTEELTEGADQLTGRIRELRNRKQALDTTINELGGVISFNEEMLEEEGLDVDPGTEDSSPIDGLTTDTEITCWTCGSEVSTSEIESTLDRLRTLRSDKLSERSEVQSEIQNCSEKRSELRKKRQKRERAERQLSDVESEIEMTQERIANLEERIEIQQSKIKELEAEAEEIKIEDHEETLELHRKSNELELRIERAESDRESLNAEIADREAAIDARDELKTERTELTDRLTELRSKIERLEADVVEGFNEHMETVLEILEYENLDRIWIESRQEEVREGRRKVTKTRFDLHIVRSTEDGTAYEDTVEHLSESEREVTGLVFALAGYLAHDVGEVIPFIILDSLEAIDSQRIAHLIEYFQAHADYVVAALLPEDAEALPEKYAYITDIE